MIILTFLDAHNRFKKVKVIKINSDDKAVYFTDDICPICGIYTVDGCVCTNCQKAHGLYKPKNTYSEV